jgi:hypothetical protein
MAPVSIVMKEEGMGLDMDMVGEVGEAASLGVSSKSS